MNKKLVTICLILVAIFLLNQSVLAECDNHQYNFSVFAIGNGSDYSLPICKQEAVDDCRADALAQLTPQGEACRSSCRDHGCSNFVISSVSVSECASILHSSSEPYFCLATGSYVWSCFCYSL